MIAIALFPYVYFAVVLALGAYFLRRRAERYTALVLWVWILSPELRRIVDYVTGRNHLSLLILAPLALTLLCVPSVVRRFGRLPRAERRAMTLIGAALLLGAVVGVARGAALAALFDLAQWIAPIAFALYLFGDEARAPEHRRAIVTTLGWTVLLVGTYGLAQFFFMPKWDQQWIWSSEMRSLGTPEPFRVRVFSILNSPAPCGTLLAAALLVLPSWRSRWRWLSGAVGFATLALCLVRSAWGAAALAAVVALCLLGGRSRARFAGSLAAMALGAVPLLLVGPTTGPRIAAWLAPPPPVVAAPAVTPDAAAPSSPIATIGARAVTVSALAHDVSFIERLRLHREVGHDVAHAPLGMGLGATGVAVRLNHDRRFATNINFDTGLLNLPYELGWLGAILFVAGALLLVPGLRRIDRSDELRPVAAAASLGVVAQLPFGNVLVGISGVILWTLWALAVGTNGPIAAVEAPPAAMPSAAPGRRAA